MIIASFINVNSFTWCICLFIYLRDIRICRVCIYIYIYIYPPPCRQAAGRVFIQLSVLQVFLDFNPLRGPSTQFPPRPISVAEPFSPPCAHLAPHVGHLARLVGHLGANMSHKCSQDARKMQSWSQHRQKMLQPPFQAPPNTKKPLFSLSFCRFSAIQPMCQNSPKMLPTCCQNLPS